MERPGLSPELIENIGKAVRQFFDDLPDGWEPGIGMIALLQIAADNTHVKGGGKVDHVGGSAG